MPLDRAVDYVDAEEAFAESTGLLFDHPQIAVTKAPGHLWTHLPTGLVLNIPEINDAANWSLQADAIWTASIFLTEHLDLMEIEDTFEGSILELGSGGGLLGIAIANQYSQASVTLSDYPDNGIISALGENIARNDLTGRITVQPLDWKDISGLKDKRYDSIVAADTLWNSQLHLPFCQTLKAGLHPKAKTHLIAGLHTGRYTLQHFITVAQSLGFVIHKLMEHHISGRETREWKVEREGESSEDRVHWLLYIRLSLV